MKSGQNVLIIGGTGFVGSTIARALAPHYNVTSTFNRPYSPIKGVNYLPYTNSGEVDHCKMVVIRAEPNVVIYCGGSNDWVYCEQNLKMTQIAHSASASNMLSAADVFKPKYIYISSDAIFSGADGNYAESDTAIPSFQIGKSKLSSENYVRNRSLNHAIIRCAPLLGRGTLEHPSFIDQLRESILREKKVKYPTKSIHNPVHISILVQTVKKIIENDIKNKTLHVGGLSKVSMFELALMIATQQELNADWVEASDLEVSGTENDYSLNFTQTLRLLKTEPLFLEQSLDLL